MTEGLDREYAIWVSQDELGETKDIHLEGKRITFRVPEQIDGHAVLRLKGLGFRSGTQTGNLFVRISLMEDGSERKYFPFRSNRQGSSFGGGSGAFPWMNRSQGREGESRPGSPFTPKETVTDPMKMRRTGSLIICAGVVLLAGGIFGILPISAWAGGILIVAGIYVSFFA